MSCENCGKVATFRCPKCSELGVSQPNFCSQACFKAAWSTHKSKHEVLKSVLASISSKQAEFTSTPSLSISDPRFAGFMFTGALRPVPIPGFTMRKVPEHIPRPDYADDPEGNPKSEDIPTVGIEVKNEEQIKGMREACRIGREVLDIAAKAVKPGVTTDELDRIVHEASVERNSYPSPLNYRRFPRSVCTSVNEVICHGIPDGRELQNGDVVNLDVTCFYKGFHGDLNETIPVGEIDENCKHLIKTTYECLEKAIACVKPGVKYRDLGDVISKHAHSNGFSVVRDYTGHGIGNLFHTNPNVPHYAGNSAKGVMHAGHTFTIEPMINMKGYPATLWPDEWTVVTKDGQRSTQFEHTLLCTEHGVEVLTARTENSYKYWFLEERVNGSSSNNAPSDQTSSSATSRKRKHK